MTDTLARDLAPCAASAHELQELWAALNAYSGFVPLDVLHKRLSALNLSAASFEHVITFDDAIYQRIPVSEGSAYEALVMTWRSGQMSPLHNHKGSACLVYVLQGIATEILFDAAPNGSLIPAATAHLKAGQIAASVDADLHIIANCQPRELDLVTLHIYSPALRHMELFDLTSTLFSKHDAVLELARNRTKHAD